MCAEEAVRGGAGLVTLKWPAEVCNHRRRNAAEVMVQPMKNPSDAPRASRCPRHRPGSVALRRRNPRSHRRSPQKDDLRTPMTQVILAATLRAR